MSRALALMLCFLASSVAAATDEDYDKVNGSIDVAAGRTIGSVSTVNGSITIGDNATVGKVDTVNGRITLGSHAKAKRLSTVNGNLIVGKDADVSERISNVNGDIRVDGAHIAGGIGTYNGNIDIAANSRIEGGILLEKSAGWSWSLWKQKPRRIVIGPGAVVQGTLKFEREVELYVSERATIGKVEGATPVRFSGEAPPD